MKEEEEEQEKEEEQDGKGTRKNGMRKKQYGHCMH